MKEGTPQLCAVLIRINDVNDRFEIRFYQSEKKKVSTTKYDDLKCSLAEIQLASVSFVDGNCWNSAHHLE